MTKKLKYTLLVAPLVSSVAWGGTEPYVSPSSPPPTPYAESPLYDWFAGGSVGYLFDAEDEFYSVHLGKKLNVDSNWTHSVFLEVGYSELENDSTEVDLSNLGIGSGSSFTGEADVEAIFVPITLNYMLEREFDNGFGFYMGLGAGVAVIDVDGDFNDGLGGLPESGNDSDTTFFAQAFAGIDYSITEKFEVFAGLRYMFIDDYSVDVPSGELEVDENDDVLAELGFRFHF